MESEVEKEHSPCRPNAGLRVQGVRLGVRGIQSMVHTGATLSTEGFALGDPVDELARKLRYTNLVFDILVLTPLKTKKTTSTTEFINITMRIYITPQSTSTTPSYNLHQHP